MPSPDPEIRRNMLEELALGLFGERYRSDEQLSALVARLRQLRQRRPVLVNATVRFRYKAPILFAGMAIPIRVDTDTTTAAHQLTLHEYFSGDQVWPSPPPPPDNRYDIPSAAFDSYGTANLDVAGGVTEPLMTYTLKLWVAGLAVGQISFLTFFSSDVSWFTGSTCGESGIG